MGSQQLLERLRRLRESANDSARSFRAYFVSYLLIVFYVLVITSNTDHSLLFREGHIQAPIINVGVPVVWFFAVTPLLLVLLHFNLLLQGLFLASRVHRYQSVIRTELPRSEEVSEARELLYPIPLALLLANSNSQWGIRFGLQVLIVTSIVILPATALIWIQVKFLPYQSETLTWMHRSILLADLGLLLGIWPRILSPFAEGSDRWRDRSSSNWSIVAFAVVAMIFVVCFANTPGSTLDTILPYHEVRDLLGRKYDLSRRTLVRKEPPAEILAAFLESCNDLTHEPEDWCSAHIAPGSVTWCRHAQPLSLNGRSFMYANLSYSTLCGAGLRTAKLSHANLMGTNLRGADLRGAKLVSANLSRALLYRADLSPWDVGKQDDTGGACNINIASMHQSEEQLGRVNELQVTKLYAANVTRAKFHGANLCNADLRKLIGHYASFHNANLDFVRLQGSLLSRADFLGTRLEGARLDDSQLNGARMIGVNLDRANLNTDYLRQLQIRGSSLNGATLNAKGLRNSANDSVVYLSDLSDIKCQRAHVASDVPESNSFVGDRESVDGSIFQDNIWRDNGPNCLMAGGRPLEWEKYYEKRAEYLVGEGACADESGYFAEGLFVRFYHPAMKQREMYARLLRELAKGQCAGVMRGWNMYRSARQLD